MLTSPRPLKDIFFCPEESDFYSSCFENLVLRTCTGSESIVEFGSGDGSPIIKSLMRTDFAGSIQGFELNPLACEAANSKIREYKLSHCYVVHNRCLFKAARPDGAYLISNPPYLPALDNDIYQPLLHGGSEGISITKKLLSLAYQNVLVLISSYSNPEGLVNYALLQDYCVSDFMVSPIEFGYYSCDPKVKSRIQDLQKSNRAFYSKNIYLLAGVLFTKKAAAEKDLSTELIQLMTCL